jgi:hypothetical protein
LLFRHGDATRWWYLAASLLSIPVAAFTQVSDTTPPVLTALSFPASVNVTKGPADFNVTMQATDNLSGVLAGVADGFLYFTSPSGVQSASGYAEVTGGTPLNATLTAGVTISQYAESGVWTLQSVEITDDTGNTAYYDAQALAAAGFPTKLSVTSVPFPTTPTLTGLSITSASLTAPGTLTVHVAATDNVSDISYVHVGVQSPTGIQTQGSLGNGSLVSGTLRSGVWEVQVGIPRYAQAGVWDIILGLGDIAGHNAGFYPSDLESEGYISTFTVVSSPEDVTPPQIKGITLPSVVDTSASSQTVQGTISVTDNLSGFSYAQLYFTSPSNGQNRTCYTSSLTSGTPLNGTYSFEFTMPQYSEEGTWTIYGITLYDFAGNEAYPDTSDLTNLGLKVNFDVIQGSPTADGILSAGTGGTVEDQRFGSRAAITVPAGLVKQNTYVSIDVLPSRFSPVIATPQGYSGHGSLFMDLTLTPTLPEPFQTPGISITVPVRRGGGAAPGSHMDLYRIDSVTGHLIPERSVSGKIISGVVAADGLSATFTGLAALSTVIGLIPNGYVIGDVNKDGVVNCTDVDIVKAAFGTTQSEKGFNPEADVNNDGVVDINDLAIVLHHLPSGLVCQ